MLLFAVSILLYYVITHLLTYVSACLCKMIRLLRFVTVTMARDTGQGRPHVQCRPTCAYRLFAAPDPDIFVCLAHWLASSFLPTLLLSAVLLPTCWAHANLYSTFRLQTCHTWRWSNGASFSMHTQETN